MKAHLLYEAPKGETRTTLLGLVVDPNVLNALQSDSMPSGGYLHETEAIYGADGQWYALGVADLKAAVPVYTVAGAEVKAQRKVAALAKLSAEDREALGLESTKLEEPKKGGKT